MIIKKVKAWKIKNSRGEPTIEVMVKSDEWKSYASAPSGASTGKKEVTAFPKEGVYKSVDFINSTIRKELDGFEFKKFNDLIKIERILKRYDKSKNWENIGGNTVIALEFALLKALARDKLWGLLNPNTNQIPRPLGNCIGGGMHVKGKEKTDFQEFLLLSLNAFSLAEAIEANNRIWKLVGKELGKPNLTDEGAWAPNLSTDKILKVLTKVTKGVYDEFGFETRIGIDAAASQLWNGKNYVYKDKKLNKSKQIAYVVDLIEKYNLVYFEDPLEETDFEGFAEITRQVKEKCLVCGDDLIATNPDLLKKAIEHSSINAVIIKPNQIGSLIKTKQTIELAKENGITPVISHRSGETKDTTISHLAVGFNIPIIKCGIYGKEREIKLKELKTIENQIRRKKQFM